MSEDVPLSYTREVGDRLRSLRRQRGLSLLAVESTSGREFKASVLGAYERGERIISVLRLQRLAHLYRVPVDQLLPRTANGSNGDRSAASSFVSETPVRIDVNRLKQADGQEAEVVRKYLAAIQAQRRDFGTNPIMIRQEDVLALGRILDRDPVGMKALLAELGARQ